MHRVESLWLKSLGVLVILLGLVLLESPRIPYTTREEIGHTGLKVRREKVIIIPHPVAVLIIGAGALALTLASRNSQQ